VAGGSLSDDAGARSGPHLLHLSFGGQVVQTNEGIRPFCSLRGGVGSGWRSDEAGEHAEVEEATERFSIVAVVLSLLERLLFYGMAFVVGG
jgi:hypothetical protein